MRHFQNGSRPDEVTKRDEPAILVGFGLHGSPRDELAENLAAHGINAQEGEGCVVRDAQARGQTGDGVATKDAILVCESLRRSRFAWREFRQRDIDDDSRVFQGVRDGARRNSEGCHDPERRKSEQERPERQLPGRQELGEALR